MAVGRLGAIHLLRKCTVPKAVFESATLEQTQAIIESNAINTLFVNENMFDRDIVRDLAEIRKIRPLKIVLILDHSIPRKNLREVKRYVDGIVDAQNSITTIERCFRQIVQGWKYTLIE